MNYKYYVSYSYITDRDSIGYGRIEISSKLPITSMKDIELMEDEIYRLRTLPMKNRKSIVILFYTLLSQIN